MEEMIANYSEETGLPYKTCPGETPYYDAATSSCIACKESEALDLEAGECVVCDEYDSETKECYTT